MTRAPPRRRKSPELWTVRMIHEDLGVPMATAETIFYRALIRPAGIRRRFVTLDGYNAWRISSGLDAH